MIRFFSLIVVCCLSAPAFAQWTNINYGTPYAVSGVSFPTNSVGYLITTSSGVPSVIKTTDGGATWNPTSSVFGFANLNNILFTSATTGYVIGGDNSNNAWVSMTTNGGASWTPTNLSALLFGGGFYQALQIWFADALHGWIVGTDGIIFNTVNGGLTWAAQYSGVTGSIVSVQFPSVTTGYAIQGGFSGFLKTIDGGLTWNAFSFLTGPYSPTSVFFTSEMTGYIVCANSTILKTLDGGASWGNGSMNSIIGAGVTLQLVYFTSANIGYVAGGNGVVAMTQDDGLTWAAQTTGTSLYLTSMSFPSPGTGYFASNDNPGILLTDNTLATKVSTLTNQSGINFYPNPAKNILNVTFDQAVTSGTTIDIVNTLGEVMRHVLVTQTTSTLDVSSLPNGDYIARVKGDNGAIAKEFSILK